MAQASREIEISGRTYTVTQLPAMRSLKMLKRLGQVAGPALAFLAGAAKTGLENAEVEALGSGLQGMLGNLSDAELEGIVKGLLDGATVVMVSEKGGVSKSDVAPAIDALFSGDLPGLFRLLAFALEVNYGNFLDALKGRVAAQPLAPAKA